MVTLVITLFLLLALSIAVIPPMLYGKHYHLLDKFNQRMAYSINCRRLYVNAVLIVLLIFHCLYLKMNEGNIDVSDAMPSTLLTFFLFSYRAGQSLFLYLRNQRVLAMVSVFVLVTLFTTHYFPLSVTLAILSLGAIFYNPSQD